tara:strand:+ start:6348 stop:7388 length:1041 start_codon:yes stop_codon:yes gene_type:complete
MDADKIKQSLTELGYKLADRGAYWQTNAIFRNGDNNTAIQIYKDTGVWKDYVEGSKFSPFQRLIEVTLGTNDPNEVKKYLEEDNMGVLYTKRKSSEKIQMEEIYPEDCLSKLLPHYKFYNDKGIGNETLKRLKGGFATTGQLNKRFVFPIYNEFGQIHGFSGRDMTVSENRPKWKHIGRKTNWIYPLHVDKKIESFIAEKKEVILVESIGDLINLHESGFDNALVTFGLDISPKLLCALVAINPDRIILSLNNDSDQGENRGLNGCIKNYLKLVKYFDPNKIVICLPTANDFGDMTKDDFKTWAQKLSSMEAKTQKTFILKKIDEISSKLSKQLLKNKKIITDSLE